MNENIEHLTDMDYSLRFKANQKRFKDRMAKEQPSLLNAPKEVAKHMPKVYATVDQTNYKTYYCERCKIYHRLSSNSGIAHKRYGISREQLNNIPITTIKPKNKKSKQKTPIVAKNINKDAYSKPNFNLSKAKPLTLDDRFYANQQKFNSRFTPKEPKEEIYKPKTLVF